MLAGQPVSAQQYPTLLADAFGEYAGRVHAQYPASTFDSASVAWASVLIDRMWAGSTFAQHQLFAEHVPTYAYEFADQQSPMYLPFPDDFPAGAFHAAEVPYLFNDDKFEAAANPAQRRLSAQMMRYWATSRTPVIPTAMASRTGHFSTVPTLCRTSSPSHQMPSGESTTPPSTISTSGPSCFRGTAFEQPDEGCRWSRRRRGTVEDTGRRHL